MVIRRTGVATYLKENLDHSTEESKWTGEEYQEWYDKLHKMVAQSFCHVNELR